MFLYKLYTLDNKFIGETNNFPDKFTGYYVHERGHIMYYNNGQWHRDGGPAIIQKCGTKEWLIKNKLHRIGGFAVESYLGKLYSSYYIDGIYVTKEEHDLLYGLMKLKGMII